MNARGQTLIEVMIASLLLAIITVPIMTAALGGRKLVVKSSQRLEAAAGARRAAEALKAFVVSESVVDDPSLVPGGGPGVGSDGWALSGDLSGLNALDEGTHTLSPSEWLPSLAASPYNGTISYTVTRRSTPQGPQPDVAFTVTWVEP